MKLNRRNLQKALTLPEVLVVIAVAVILVCLLLPALYAPTTPAYRVQCINNLKQDGLAFRQWAIDNNGQYPMSVSTANGGTMEFVSKGGVYFHFFILSNELNTPKILYCPKDGGHKPATTFTNGFTEANISYFVGVDAPPTNANMFLTGDRNLTNGVLPPTKILELKSNGVIGWTEKIHINQGNVGLADGSVQSLSTSKVREALANTGVATNRLAMPW